MKRVPHTLKSFLWYFMKPYKASFVFLFLLGIVWAIETSLTPYIMKEIIDKISAYKGTFSGSIKLLTPFIVAYVGLTAINGLSFRIREWILLKTMPAMKKDMWAFMFNHLLEHS